MLGFVPKDQCVSSMHPINSFTRIDSIQSYSYVILKRLFFHQLKFFARYRKTSVAVLDMGPRFSKLIMKALEENSDD